MPEQCTHIVGLSAAAPTAEGCEECMATGDTWFHLRMCMHCGHIGCCDQSKNRHAAAHFRASDHPLIQSYEPGEDWWWCYVDEVAFRLPDAPNYEHP